MCPNDPRTNGSKSESQKTPPCLRHSVRVSPVQLVINKTLALPTLLVHVWDTHIWLHYLESALPLVRNSQRSVSVALIGTLFQNHRIHFLPSICQVIVVVCFFFALVLFYFCFCLFVLLGSVLMSKTSVLSGKP